MFAYDGEDQLNNLIASEFSKGTACFLLRSGKKSIESIINLADTDTSYHISSFDITEGLILIKMPSLIHCAAAHEINYLILQKLQPMKLDKAIRGYPGASIRGEESSRGKEPDYSWCPVRRPRSSAHPRMKMPSVALEVAVSENDKKLNADVRYLLSPEDGNAELCLTLRVDKVNNNIRLESWARQDANNDQQRSHIHRTQVVYARITQDGRAIVTGDLPFRIPFESLMLRPTDPGTAAEQDILFSQNDLEELSEKIWNADDVAEDEEE
ncbi:hypothetical protein N7468_001857 [Penicillium chermesinum]|uniref:Uncharacterized protein n=1 Tax=Penicillium chermesinum TaxID=63820 RepID=A0A9W9PHC0_9EURO|nr:uncharacterized protein N7468_001857 [Penicillium chermesinum]KAJ5246874.1 hypothetical protein N7468_001857 [Penicillium chermesinum]KAJ6145129.1 hypothetical protein N7470_009024 [Penicillium chermesinum]